MATEEATGLDSFFYQQSLYGRHRGPALIVLITGLVWALQPVSIFYALSPDVRRDIQNAVATDWMIHFMVPVFLWVFFWVAFLLLIHFVGARMRVGRLFRLTGWGMVPFVLVGLTRSIGNYLAYQDETLPHGVTMGRFDSEWRGYQGLLSEMSGDPTLVATIAASCVFLLVSAYIWTYVIEYSTDIENPSKIRLIVAVPIILYVIYSLVPHFV